MTMSIDVNLPKDHPARFPDRCVVCGIESPDSTMRVFTNAIGWWTWLFWIFGKPFFIRLPACTGCSRWLHVRRFLDVVITIGIIVLAYGYLRPLVPRDLPRFVQKVILMGLLLLCFLPCFILNIFFPPPFDLTAFEKSVDYEFRDAELAQEFAELNQDAEWVKDLLIPQVSLATCLPVSSGSLLTVIFQMLILDRRNTGSKLPVAPGAEASQPWHPSRLQLRWWVMPPRNYYRRRLQNDS